MYAETFRDPDQLNTHLANAIGGAITLALPTHPLDWNNPDDAQLMRSCHGKLNTGIAAIPELLRLLTGETTDALVFMAVATSSATPAQLAELLESDEFTIGDRIHREESRRLDVLDQRLADIPAEHVTSLRLVPSGLALDNLPEPDRDALTQRFDTLTNVMQHHLLAGTSDAVPAQLAQSWITPWRPSVLINLDRQLWKIHNMPEPELGN